MPFRVTDASMKTKLLAQIATGQQRGVSAQERLASGKRINRPSDDPTGTEAVIRLRTIQAAVEQFRRNGQAATVELQTTDSTVESYEQTLDRVRTLLLNGITEPNSPGARAAIATEIDGIRDGLLTTANMTTTGGQYLFGGTRQNVPPFDPVTALPAATATSQQLLRVEPGAPPVVTGVTADQLFSNVTGTVFTTLTAAAAALRGTGIDPLTLQPVFDPVVDKATLDAALTHTNELTDLTSTMRGRIGASLKRAEISLERLDRDFLSLETTAGEIEGADFAESAIDLTEAENALQAILQSTARINNRGTLLDLIG